MDETDKLNGPFEIEPLGGEFHQQLQQAKARTGVPNPEVPAVTRHNIGVSPDLDSEVARITFIPGLVPGFEDRAIVLHDQNVLIHEPSNFPIMLSLARQYKKAREAADSQAAIAGLTDSVDVIQKAKLHDISQNQELLDEVFERLSESYPNLYKTIAEYSKRMDQQRETRKRFRADRSIPVRPEDMELSGEETALMRYYFSAALDAVAQVMEEIGQPEKLYDVINLIVR